MASGEPDCGFSRCFVLINGFSTELLMSTCYDKAVLLSVLSGLWWTVMWWDAAGLNFLKASTDCVKKKAQRTQILGTQAR